jgi:hypothetical protein
MKHIFESLGHIIKVTRADGSIIRGKCVSIESAIESELSCDTISIQQSGYREMIPDFDIKRIEIIDL